MQNKLFLIQVWHPSGTVLISTRVILANVSNVIEYDAEYNIPLHKFCNLLKVTWQC